MNVDDAVESSFAFARKKFRQSVAESVAKGDPYGILLFTHLAKALEQASVFYLGDISDLSDCVSRLKDDLNADLKACRNKLLMPYPSIFMIGRQDPSQKLLSAPEEAYPGKVVIASWAVTLVTLLPDDWRSPGKSESRYNYAAVGMMYDTEHKNWDTHQGGTFCLTQEDDGPHIQMLTRLGIHTNIVGDQYSEHQAKVVMTNSVSAVMLISHPFNYIVRETPALTPKETRRIAKGKTYPDRKRPRYRIVDHDVLVHLSQGILGTHESPVPHKRRGHWRRLSDRCVHAKDRGVDRVPVRDAWVGDAEFEVDGKRYQVLLDFQSKVRSQQGV